jgi:hypothetical protein
MDVSLVVSVVEPVEVGQAVRIFVPCDVSEARVGCPNSCTNSLLTPYIIYVGFLGMVGGAAQLRAAGRDLCEPPGQARLPDAGQPRRVLVL